MFRVFCLFVTVFKLSSGSLTPDEYGYETVFYSLLNARDEASFRSVQRDYMNNIKNENVDPCDDFYEYACGNWANVVSKKNGTYTVAAAMSHGIDYTLFKLLSEDIVSDDMVAVKAVKRFFRSCVNNSALDYTELTIFLDILGSWPLTSETWSSVDFDWFMMTAHAHAFGADVIFQYRRQDQDRPFKLNYFDVLEFSPIQHFWKKKSIKTTEEFVTAIKDVFALLNLEVGEREEMLGDVFDFEKRLIFIKTDCGSGENDQLESMTMEEFSSELPEIDFGQYFRVLGGREDIITWDYAAIINKKCFKDVFDMVRETEDSVLANDIYLNLALHFTMAADNKGNKCAVLVKHLLTPAALFMFQNRFYDNETKREMHNIYSNMLEAGKYIINQSDWFDAETREKALEVFQVLEHQIGFDEQAINEESLNATYNFLNFDEDHFIKNLIKAFRHRVMRDQTIPFGVGELQEPFTVNALFVPVLYIMSVPLAIMQPPIFHKFAPAFSNYGAMAAVVGHELTHAFDLENFKEKAEEGGETWLDPRLQTTYFTKLECYLSQYDRFMPEGVNRTVSGGMTLSENIADNKGLSLAYKAYTYCLRNQIETEHGLSNDDGQSLDNLQAFFLSYAQSYCGDFTTEHILELLEDVHAPSSVRVLGTLSNSKDFARAFNCPLGSKMNPEKKCTY